MTFLGFMIIPMNEKLNRALNNAYSLPMQVACSFNCTLHASLPFPMFDSLKADTKAIEEYNDHLLWVFENICSTSIIFELSRIPMPSLKEKEDLVSMDGLFQKKEE